MSKEKVIVARNLKDWTKFTTQINEKQKQFHFFLTRHFCVSLTKLNLCFTLVLCYNSQRFSTCDTKLNLKLLTKLNLKFQMTKTRMTTTKIIVLIV